MNDICTCCRFLRVPPALAEPEGPVKSAAMLAARNKRRREASMRLALEGAMARGGPVGPLESPPRYLEWCLVKSDPAAGLYFFREQQKADDCVEHECEHHPLRVTPIRTGEYSVPLGLPVSIDRVLTTTGNTHETDFVFADDQGTAPVIAGRGFTQTYMIFGGPGAGKTTFFKHLLKRILHHPLRPGCLLLDPKGAELPEWLGRHVDREVLRVGPNSPVRFNVFGSQLPARELGRLLADIVITQAGDIDRGWQVLVNDLLESAVVTLAASGPVTPRRLLDEILYPITIDDNGQSRSIYPIERTASKLFHSGTATQDEKNSVLRLFDYFRSEEKNRLFTRQLIEKFMGDLRSDIWANLSVADGLDLYDEVITKQGIVVVSVGYGNAAFQDCLLTLVKAVFQQYALGQLGMRRPSDPFFVLACDEYATIVTEGTSGLVSDAAFFSQSRQAGCLSLLALQSIATARSRFPASVRDRWDGILGNVAGRVFMKLNDIQTAQFASDLLGKRQTAVRSTSTGVSSQGSSSTTSYSFLDQATVPAWVFTSRLNTFYGLAHGSFDGITTTASFVRVPLEEIHE